MISLNDLSDRLEIAVPARNAVPADYEQLVKDAVLQLSQDVPMARTTTINVVAGTVVYNLPSDFLSLISLPMPAAMGDVLITASGLIPMAVGGLDERYEIVGGQIIFTPTPVYSMARTMRYAALYALDENENYPTLTENLARIALLYAQATAFAEQASSVAGDGWKYQIGDEMVDKTGQGKSISASADSAMKRYQDAVRRFSGYGSKAYYAPGTVF